MTRGTGAKHVLHLVDDLVEVRADTVELVDVDDTSHFRLIGVAPVGFGLRLNTTGTTENTNTSVENLEGTVNFNREVNVPWCVDDVEAVRACLYAPAQHLARSKLLQQIEL